MARAAAGGVLLVVWAALSGCATGRGGDPSAPPEAPPEAPPSAAAPAAPPAPSTQARLTDAAVAPLNDLNLVRAPIPPALAAAQKGPYAAPPERTCAALGADVAALDAVLGADLDTPPTATNPGLIERGSGAAGDAVVGALRHTTEGVIPFRGWVRKLSGAERYARDVAAAIAAGTIRRAYLKGLADAAGCDAPTAPRRSP